VSFMLNFAVFIFAIFLMYIVHNNPASLAARSINTYVCKSQEEEEEEDWRWADCDPLRLVTL